MIRTFKWFVLVASLVLAACSDSTTGNGGDNGYNDDRDGWGDGDVTPHDSGTNGDDTVEVRFHVDFGGVEEPCMVHLTCEGEDGPRTTSRRSGEAFKVARDASCVARIGDNTDDALTADGRPTHTTPDGKVWAKTVRLEGFQGGDEVIVADRYFEAETLGCNILYPTGVGASYTDHNVYVSESGIFEVPGVASDGSWFQVTGSHFDYGGRAEGRGWRVLNLDWGTNNATFTVDKANNAFDVHCSW